MSPYQCTTPRSPFVPHQIRADDIVDGPHQQCVPEYDTPPALDRPDKTRYPEAGIHEDGAIFPVDPEPCLSRPGPVFIDYRAEEGPLGFPWLPLTRK